MVLGVLLRSRNIIDFSLILPNSHRWSQPAVTIIGQHANSVMLSIRLRVNQ